MRIHLVNPSDVSFGTAVITPRWQYVLAAATPARHGTPVLVDETLEPLDEDSIQPGDVVGIGIHTGNALRGYRIGQAARTRGAFVVFGGIHSTLFPDEARERPPHRSSGVRAPMDTSVPLYLRDHALHLQKHPMTIASATSRLAMPTVATVRTSREERRKRRTMATSTTMS